MYIKQLYTSCLAEAAYYIESNGEAVIIDPLRETTPYLELAAERGTKIKYVFETHFHADFVSGHIDLAKKTGASIVYGPGAKPSYDIVEATDNQEFEVGAIKIKVLHTPGHTIESSCYLLIDEHGKEHAVFTGDTLFIGDVGRPDLAIKSNLTREDLAGMLFDSLRNKVMKLGDDVILYPGHGAGSSCGKNLSSETVCSIGEQKKSNYALQDISKTQFINEVTDGILPPPKYFAKDAMKNKEGYDSIDDIVEKGMTRLSIEEFKTNMETALVLDTRHQQTFVKGFIPESLFIGIDGSFATWVGEMIEDLNQPIILITEEGREEETIIRLARVGYDNVLGYLYGSFDTWKNADEIVWDGVSINAEEFKALAEANLDGSIMDVRKPSEYDTIKLEDADNYSLSALESLIEHIDENEKFYVHCRSGYRSMIALSILKAHGIHNLVEIDGGITAIENVGMEVVSSIEAE
jgi:hydroxyacylglutathione hydrolase